jgi:Zn-dependent peptidase ImmA (M78 family)
LDLVALMSESFLRRFGLDSRDRLTEIAEEFGIDVLYRPAESYDGALLRIRDAQRGCIVINSRIREESRKRFTLAHEIGHLVLPGSRKYPLHASSKGLKTGTRISIAPNSKQTASPPRF